MLGETHKAAREAQRLADGDTELKAACLRGDAGAAAQLLPAAPEAERDAAFVVAVARGQEDLLAALPALAQGGGAAARMWDVAWARAADDASALEMGAAAVEALMSGAAEVAGGVDRRAAATEEVRAAAGGEGATALLRSAKGGHELAVRRLLRARPRRWSSRSAVGRRRCCSRRRWGTRPSSAAW